MVKRRAQIQVRTVDERPVRCRVVEAVRSGGDPAALRLPLLLLHGLGCSADVWQPVLRCLARHELDQPVWAPDLPGCGRFPGPPEALAQRHPERVGGMVLVGPTAGKHVEHPQRYAVGLVMDGLHDPLLYTRLLVRMYREMGLQRYLETARRMLEDDPLAGIDAVTAPCLVLRGQHDEVVPAAMARRLAAALPHAVYLEMSGARHVVPIDLPERLAVASVAFLAGVGKAGAQAVQLRCPARR